jgi:glutamine synthetase
MQSVDVAQQTRSRTATDSTSDAAQVLEGIRAGDFDEVIVGGCDLNGVFRAKRIPAARFAAMDEPGVEFSEYMWVMDIDDYPQPRPEGFQGWWPDWTTGYGDVEAVADLSTLRDVPWLNRTALVLCNYKFSDGRDYEIAPRNVLCRVADRFERMGLEPRMAPELEFVVVRETEATAISKGFRDLTPLSPRPMPYGAMQATLDSAVIGPLANQLRLMRIPIEAWAPEGSRGQYELNLSASSPVEAADNGFLFKHGVKEICALEGMLATFMSKVSEEYGSSLHVHQSVWRDGEPAFYDGDDPEGLSPMMRHYAAGQLQTLREMTAIWCPTTSAYKRGGPYSAAGTTEAWGADNKTLSLRALATEGASCRLENRVPGADANVYLVLAAMLAGGLHGIENELELPPPTTGDAYANNALKRIPKDLPTAISMFEESAVANEYLGEEFVAHYAASRRWELEQAERFVTDWELNRYYVRA